MLNITKAACKNIIGRLIEMRWVLSRKRYEDRSIPLTDVERGTIYQFFDLIGASKFCTEKLLPGSIVFLASHEGMAKASQDDEPEGFTISSASIDYMPMAYDGIEDEFQSEMQWFDDLPSGYKKL